MNAAPLIVGFVALLALTGSLVLREPSPGALATPHAEIGSDLATCATCHTADGLDAGCIACHKPIAKQIETGRGFHAERATDCASCHPDHHGRSFDVMEAIAWREGERKGFDHGHVAFELSGSHDDLVCERCHGAGTYVGLQQKCANCHEDVHGGDLFGDCANCHDQQNFKPASLFDHDKTFPLAGPHATATCAGCHGGLDYKEVKGRTCAACHESPHRFESPNGCVECHLGADEVWPVARTRFDVPRHAETGFALVEAHVEVACVLCHKPGPDYAARFPNPPRVEEDCLTCHGDVHAGQFKAACTTCHDQAHFVPARYGLAEHTTFALRGAHEKTKCRACHTEVEGTRRFIDTPRTCAECHTDPHAGQFNGACTTCHDENAFVPARYGLAEHTQFPLRGAHVKTKCRACHTEVEGTRRFTDTPSACADCHDDPHAGQFKESCDRCHDERAFVPARYPMARHSTFLLTGAHGGVACNSCHTMDKKVRRFVGTANRCAQCHDNPHGTQFAREMKTGGCAACHDTSSFRTRPYDHTAYPLEGKHASADCARCHRRSGTPPTRQFRGTSRNCANCHRDEHRGQFAGRSCGKCHTGFRDWEVRRFNHDRTRFPLDKQHRGISCDDCHARVKQRDGHKVTQYRPLGHQCKDCHEVKGR